MRADLHKVHTCSDTNAFIPGRGQCNAPDLADLSRGLGYSTRNNCINLLLGSPFASKAVTGLPFQLFALQIAYAVHTATTAKAVSRQKAVGKWVHITAFRPEHLEFRSGQTHGIRGFRTPQQGEQLLVSLSSLSLQKTRIVIRIPELPDQVRLAKNSVRLGCCIKCER